MNTYQVQCIARANSLRPLPVERIEAPHSFAARKDYAGRHGIDFLDCYAKRAWADGTTNPHATLR